MKNCKNYKIYKFDHRKGVKINSDNFWNRGKEYLMFEMSFINTYNKVPYKKLQEQTWTWDDEEWTGNATKLGYKMIESELIDLNICLGYLRSEIKTM